MKLFRSNKTLLTVQILVSWLAFFGSYSVLAEPLEMTRPPAPKARDIEPTATFEDTLVETRRVLNELSENPNDFQGAELFAFVENLPQRGHAFIRFITKSRKPRQDLIIGLAKGQPIGTLSNTFTEVFSNELFALVETKVFDEYLETYFLNRDRVLVRTKIETTPLQRQALIRNLLKQVNASIRRFLSSQEQTRESLAETSQPIMYNAVQMNCVQLLFEFLKASGIDWKDSETKALPIFPRDVGTFSYDVGLSLRPQQVYRSGKVVADDHHLLVGNDGSRRISIARLKANLGRLSNYELVMLKALHKILSAENGGIDRASINVVLGSEFQKRKISGDYSTAGFFLR